jgi:hypothetical protein
VRHGCRSHSKHPATCAASHPVNAMWPSACRSPSHVNKVLQSPSDSNLMENAILWFDAGSPVSVGRATGRPLCARSLEGPTPRCEQPRARPPPRARLARSRRSCMHVH